MLITEWRDASQKLANCGGNRDKMEAAKDEMREAFATTSDAELGLMCVDILSMLRERDIERYASVIAAAIMSG